MNKYCLWVGWGSPELHRGLGFKLGRVCFSLKVHVSIRTVRLHMTLLVMVEIRVQAPVACIFQVSHYIVSTNIPLAKSSQMAESKIRSQRSTLCLLMVGTAKSCGKGHGYKGWCPLFWFASNNFIFLTHNTLNTYSLKWRG